MADKTSTEVVQYQSLQRAEKDIGGGSHARVVGAVAVLTSTTGEQFLASGAGERVLNPDGTVAYTEITDGGATYRQTLTWTNGELTAWTGWVKQ